MNGINILIVDDDLKKIAKIIDAIKEVVEGGVAIDQATSVKQAFETLKNKAYHLMITDLNMPLREGEIENINGGRSLIRNIYRDSKSVNVPMYIIGLTQFEELKESFNGFWKIIYFDSSSDDWKQKLKGILNHINLVKTYLKTETIETIFVEGETDNIVLSAVLKLCYPLLLGKLKIESVEYGGGADWVERQVFIWSKSLNVREKEYVKCVGLFDNDKSGIDSYNKLIESITTNSAEDKTFALLKTSYKYSTILKSIKSKGIMFPTALEDLSAGQCFIEAEKKGWLIPRDLKSLVIDSKILKSTLGVSNIDFDYLKNAGFDEIEILFILYKVNDTYKSEYAKYLKNTDKENLLFYTYLMKECIEKLKIKI
jgi:CheY-like chemotaxis protein